MMLWRFPNMLLSFSEICPLQRRQECQYRPFLLQAGAPLFRQLTNAYSEENAVEDALYFLGRALGEGALDCDGYLKQVRVLSRRQFLLRETMDRCRRKAGLSV